MSGYLPGSDKLAKEKLMTNGYQKDKPVLLLHGTLDPMVPF